MAVIIAGLKLDVESRMAAVLFAIPTHQEHGITHRGALQAGGTWSMAFAAEQAAPDHQRCRHQHRGRRGQPAEMKAQVEVLRKMLLAMVEDIRVVLLRLASRTQTLRFYAANPDELRVQVARETLSSIRRWPTGSASGN
jgi:GTP pyrophosphokinase